MSTEGARTVEWNFRTCAIIHGLWTNTAMFEKFLAVLRGSGKTVLLIKAHFDESWNPNRPRMFAVAGILAAADQWDQIETGWKTALAEKTRSWRAKDANQFPVITHRR